MKSNICMVAAFAAALFISAPVQAQGYEGLIAAGNDSGNSRGGQNSTGGYDGVVVWNNGNGETPTDIYSFVEGSGTQTNTNKHLKAQQRVASEARAKAEAIRKGNEAEQKRMKAEADIAYKQVMANNKRLIEDAARKQKEWEEQNLRR